MTAGIDRHPFGRRHSDRSGVWLEHGCVPFLNQGTSFIDVDIIIKKIVLICTAVHFA